MITNLYPCINHHFKLSYNYTNNCPLVNTSPKYTETLGSVWFWCRARPPPWGRGSGLSHTSTTALMDFSIPHAWSKRMLLAGDDALGVPPQSTATSVGQGIWHVPRIHHASILRVAMQEDSLAYTFTVMKVHTYPSPSSLIVVGLCWWGSLILEVGWLLHNI